MEAPTIRLYHFTGAEHLTAVRRDGLREGQIPIRIHTTEERGAHAHYMGGQWLTEQPDWEAQEVWNERLDHDHTAYRLTINVPKSARAGDSLRRYVDVSDAIEENVRGEIEAAGMEEWWIYRGPIPRGWVRDVVERPAEFVPRGKVGAGELVAPTPEEITAARASIGRVPEGRHTHTIRRKR